MPSVFHTLWLSTDSYRTRRTSLRPFLAGAETTDIRLHFAMFGKRAEKAGLISQGKSFMSWSKRQQVFLFIRINRLDRRQISQDLPHRLWRRRGRVYRKGEKQLLELKRTGWTDCLSAWRKLSILYQMTRVKSAGRKILASPSAN